MNLITIEIKEIEFETEKQKIKFTVDEAKELEKLFYALFNQSVSAGIVREITKCEIMEDKSRKFTPSYGYLKAGERDIDRFLKPYGYDANIEDNILKVNKIK